MGHLFIYCNFYDYFYFQHQRITQMCNDFHVTIYITPRIIGNILFLEINNSGNSLCSAYSLSIDVGKFVIFMYC